MSTVGHNPQPAWLNAQCPRHGRYVVGPLLGRGGMGDVHEAWDVVLCRTVALKVLKAIEPAALIRFMHEAQIHARVVHPNICRIYDVDNYEGTLRVAMQLVHGSNLEQARKELDVKEIVTIMALVAQAVHVVHRLNLVHRDLKPSNILLEQNTEGQWIPYVCDFGLAMALDEPALTYSHGVIGTPAYMAPEQLHGDRNRISAATDVYALGGTLHFALTGRPPGYRLPKGQNAEDPTIPRDLRTILAKCLEEDPELRYPTASALAEDLWRFQQGEPIQAAHGSKLIRLGRRRLESAKSYLMVLAAGILTSAAWWAVREHTAAANLRQAALAQQFSLEAGNLAKDLRLEMMLPMHDLRPTYGRIRDQIGRDRSRLLAMAPNWQGQAHFALGSASYLLRDYGSAQAELEQAWNAGLHDSEVACPLAFAASQVATVAEETARFDSAQPAQVPVLPAGHQETFLRQAMGPDSDAGQTAEAVLSYLRKDYRRGAATSHAIFLAYPWHWEAAVLESTCIRGLGRQEMDQGHLDQASIRFQEAMAAAKAALAVGKSDPLLYHAYFEAARGLASVNLESGSLSQPFMTELLAASDRALRLDPGDQELQEDWLGLRWLQARLLMQLDRDPGPVLDASRAFLETSVREPLTVHLRAGRMLIFWQIAERDFRKGGDPGPAFMQALSTSGHTAFFFRDYFWEMMNFKARVDAAQGADPRPALDAAMEHLQPLAPGVRWTLKESFADSWLIRAEWETAHHLDPSASLRHARALTASARSQNPNSSASYALEGLSQVIEMKAFPEQRPRLMRVAQEHLKQALARNPQGLRPTLLKRRLQDLTREP